MAKRPSFQFYPGDWLRDMALRSCSVEARGLWIDMLCFMVEGNPFGYLKVGNKVILPPNLAVMVGLTLEVVVRLLQELEDAEVFSKDGAGCIYSRRMVRDESIRSKRAAGGHLGGNPNLKKSKKEDNYKVNLKDNLTYEDEDKEEDEDKKEKKEGIRGKKEKEIKTEFEPGVLLTKKEYDNLVSEFSVLTVHAACKFLSSYKIEKSYKTKSDNLTIRRWVIDAVRKNQTYGQANNHSGPSASATNSDPGTANGTSGGRIQALREW